MDFIIYNTVLSPGLSTFILCVRQIFPHIHTQIVKTTKYIVRRLSYHKKIREFIMNNF